MKNKRYSVYQRINGQWTFQRTTEIVPISANTHPLLSLVGYKLLTLCYFSDHNTPHRSSYNIYIDDNISRPVWYISACQVHGACLCLWYHWCLYPCPGACPSPCCMSMSILHVRFFAAYSWHAICPGLSSCCMYMSVIHVYCPWCMSMLHARVNAARPCPFCKFMSMLHKHDHASCPFPCCICMSMLHIYAASLCCTSMMHVQCPRYEYMSVSFCMFMFMSMHMSTLHVCIHVHVLC